MLRQASSRNHRSKGLKLKKALQTCLLLVVSVWLLYQVKRPYDKKRAYDDGDSHTLRKDDDSRHDMFKFGRKDLPLSAEPDLTLETRTEEEENEEIEELEQEAKHEEDVDDEKAEGGDDAKDEQDQDNNEDGAKHRGGDSEMTEKDGDEPGVFEDEDNKERVNAEREKSFHGDDVASAVVHNTPETEQEDPSHEGRERNYQDDNASSAVVHGIHEMQEAEPVSVNVTVRSLDEDHLNTGEMGLFDAENLANGTTEGGPRRNKSSIADEHGALSNDKFSYNSTGEEHSNHLGRNIVPITSNATNKPIEPEQQANSNSPNSQAEHRMNSTIVANIQTEFPTNLTDISASAEVVDLKNETSSLDSARARDVSATRVAGSQIVVNPAETNLSSSISSNERNDVATE